MIIYEPDQCIELIEWVSDTHFKFDGCLWKTRKQYRNKSFTFLMKVSRCVEGEYKPNVLSYLFIFLDSAGKKDWIITTNKYWKQKPTVFSLARKRYDLIYLTKTKQFKSLLED